VCVTAFVPIQVPRDQVHGYGLAPQCGEILGEYLPGHDWWWGKLLDALSHVLAGRATDRRAHACVGLLELIVPALPVLLGELEPNAECRNFVGETSAVFCSAKSGRSH